MAPLKSSSIPNSNLRSRRTQLIFISALLIFSLLFFLNYFPLTPSFYSFHDISAATLSYSNFISPLSFQNGSGLVLAAQKITPPSESGSGLETHFAEEKIVPVSTGSSNRRENGSALGLAQKTMMKVAPVSSRTNQSEHGSGLVTHHAKERVRIGPVSPRSRNRAGNGSGLDQRNSAKSCDIFDGKWVLDNQTDPLYPPGSCPHLDYAFNCFNNGRSDLGYLKYRWQPHGCDIPRFDGKMMLEMLRGKRMVFVGDSLSRNMWESLVCAVRMSTVDKTRVFEVSGRRQFRTEGFYSFVFKDYNCTIEFMSSPFLVQRWKWPKQHSRWAGRETLRLDMMQATISKYHNADFIIFNTAHWWTHSKTKEGKNYFQEGDVVYKKLKAEEAYTKALQTWAKWVDENVNKKKTKVFFTGYSSTHFRGGQWNSGGNCDGETEPITNDKFLAPYPKMMQILESVMPKMRTPVVYLNISKMTGYRKDGHPSKFGSPGLRSGLG